MKIFIVSYAIVVSITLVVFTYYTTSLFNEVANLNAHNPKAESIPPEVFSFIDNPSHFKDDYNILSAYIGRATTLIHYKDFTHVSVIFGGAIAYLNATVDEFPRNASITVKGIFPDSHSFPVLQYLSSPFTIAKTVDPINDITSFSTYNIQSNGIDVQIVFYIPDNVGPNPENTWILDPIEYSYIE